MVQMPWHHYRQAVQLVLGVEKRKVESFFPKKRLGQALSPARRPCLIHLRLTVPDDVQEGGCHEPKRRTHWFGQRGA